MKPYLGFLQHGSSKLPFPMISLASQKPIRFSEKNFLCEIFCINVWFKRFLYLFFSVFSSSLCMYQPYRKIRQGVICISTWIQHTRLQTMATSPLRSNVCWGWTFEISFIEVTRTICYIWMGFPFRFQTSMFISK